MAEGTQPPIRAESREDAISRNDVLDFVGVGSCRLAADGSIVSIDRRSLAILSRSSAHPDPTDLTSQSIASLLGDSPSSNEFLRRLNQENDSWEFEMPVRTLLDSERWVRCWVNPLSADGQVDVLLRDITEKKRLEQRLRQTEEHYRGLIEASPNAIVLLGLDTRVRMANRLAAQMCGYESPEAMIGVSALDLIVEEDREGAMQNLQKALQQGILHSVRYTGVRPDGSRYPAETSCSVVQGDDGQPTGVMLSSRDTTQRMRAETEWREIHERYRALFDHSQEAIYLHDMQGSFLDANDRALSLFGFTRDEIDQAQFGSLLAPEDIPRALASMRRILEHGSKETPNEYRLTTRDGRQVWVETQGVRLDSGGKPQAILGIARDITRHRQIEEELRLYQQELQTLVEERTAELERAKEQLRHSQKMEAMEILAGGIAHDFNNMLTGILGQADLLKIESDPTSDIYRIAEGIEQLVQRATELTRRLLGFARKQKTRKIPVDMHQLIDKTLAITSRVIDRRIEMTKELSAEPPVVEGDPAQLQQVLMNLIANARDAMPNGGRMTFESRIVTVNGESTSISPELEAGRYFVLSVSDTGRGMSPEVRERVFEPFFTTKPEGKGAPIGLAMVYLLVRNHHGVVTLTSKEGKGSVFSVFLPMSDQLAPLQTAVKTDEPTSGAGHILVVDDELVVRQVLERVLTSTGYQVSTARNGQEGIKEYEAHQDEIDLVIIDMIMPVMNGRDCYLALKALNPDVKAILSTGYAFEGWAQDLLSRGVAGTLRKPFTPTELLQVVTRVLDLTDE